MAGAIPSGANPGAWVAATPGTSPSSGYDPTALVGSIVAPVTGAGSTAGQVVSGGLSSLGNWTQSFITAAYQDLIANDPVLTDLSDLVFEGLEASLGLPLAIVTGLAKAFGITPTTGSGGTTTVTSVLTDIEDFFSTVVSDGVSFAGSLLQELTGAAGGTVADLAAWFIQMFTAPIDPARLTVVPVSSIAATSTNVLANGSFSDSTSLVAGGAWSWDGTVDHTGIAGSGSAKVACDAMLQAMNSNLITVSPGQQFTISGWVKWSNVEVATSSNAFQIGVQPVDSGAVESLTVLAGIESPAASGAWTELTASYTVPAGVTQIAVQVAVMPNVRAGSVWFDDLSVVQTGILSGSLVTGPFTTIFDDLGSLVDSVVSELTGLAGSGFTQSQATAALSQQAATTAANSASIAALQTAQVAADNSGVGVTVNFSKDANATSIPAVFTQIDGGASTIGISGGSAVWQPSGTTSSTSMEMYNVEPTATDYQLISAVFDSAMNPGPFNYLYGRANSASDPTAYVYAELQSNAVVIGYVNGSTNTPFITETVAFQANAIYSLVCGISGSVNTYQILLNGAPIAEYVDAAGVAQIGSGFRWTGWGMFGDYNEGFFGFGAGWVLPASVLQWGMADSAPGPTVGSYLRVFRENTTPVQMLSGTNQLFDNFFDSVDRNTSDITWNAATSTATVSTAGTYVMVVRLLADGDVGLTWQMARYQNSILEEYGFPVDSPAGGLRDTFVFYANAGDTITPGIDLISGSVAYLMGNSDSVSCYMTLAKVNP